MIPHTGRPRTSPAANPLAALALGVALLGGCRESGAPCETLCQRARTCRAELAEALQARLPDRSPALQRVRRELPGRLLERLLGTCGERCETLRRKAQWRDALAKCRPEGGCADFARCVAPMLEP